MIAVRTRTITTTVFMDGQLSQTPCSYLVTVIVSKIHNCFKIIRMMSIYSYPGWIVIILMRQSGHLGVFSEINQLLAAFSSFVTVISDGTIQLVYDDPTNHSWSWSVVTCSYVYICFCCITIIILAHHFQWHQVTSFQGVPAPRHGKPTDLLCLLGMSVFSVVGWLLVVTVNDDNEIGVWDFCQRLLIWLIVMWLGCSSYRID